MVLIIYTGCNLKQPQNIKIFTTKDPSLDPSQENHQDAKPQAQSMARLHKRKGSGPEQWCKW